MGGGGGGGGLHRYIIMPLHGPTYKMVLARIQFRLISNLDPSVAKDNLIKISKMMTHGDS